MKILYTEASSLTYTFVCVCESMIDTFGLSTILYVPFLFFAFSPKITDYLSGKEIRSKATSGASATATYQKKKTDIEMYCTTEKRYLLSASPDFGNIFCD